MARVKVADLDWFKIRDYEAFRAWSNEDMFWQLSQRRNALIWEHQGKLDEQSIAGDQVLRAIQRGPVWHLHQEQKKLLSEGETRFGFCSGGHSDVYVRELTTMDALSLRYHLADENPPDMPYSEYMEILNDRTESYVYVKVNVDAHLEVIKDAFLVWLRQVQKRRPYMGEVHETRSTILDYQVIPYIDLCLFESITGNHIDRESRADALMAPSDLNKPPTTNKISERLKKWAGVAISDRFLASLRADDSDLG